MFSHVLDEGPEPPTPSCCSRYPRRRWTSRRRCGSSAPARVISMEAPKGQPARCWGLKKAPTNRSRLHEYRHRTVPCLPPAPGTVTCESFQGSSGLYYSTSGCIVLGARPEEEDA